MDEHALSALASRFREGDEESFRRLVDALTRTLIAMAYRYTGDWEWARDLTQETWIRVHEQISRYDPSRSFVSWLHAVHRNACLDHVRRAWVRREAAVPPGELARAGGAAADDPALEVERREFRQRVLAVARGLSESQRQVFVRVDVEQREQAEVAREMGIRPGTLRTTLHFARRRMAQLLDGLEEGT
ncbi:MAG: DNA-directed RNA polymerase sigma-70 factor [Gemmatimonadota bacterium]